MSASSCAGPQFRREQIFARRSSLAIYPGNCPRPRNKRAVRVILCAALALCVGSSLLARAAVSAVTVHSPSLSSSATTNVTSPVHFEATAESDASITGYVVYVDNQNVYRNFSSLLDAWVVLTPGTTHSLYIKAWDSTGSLLSTATYWINVTGAAVPTPPPTATREYPGDSHLLLWTVDNNPYVGGNCNDGSIATFANGLDPNTNNSPDLVRGGQHFLLTSRCQYDDSLFFWKDPNNPQPNHTNFLWDFWFYVPTSTQASSVQALEFDLFQAVRLSDGVHEFMFGSQCNYAANQWQVWLPAKTGLTWVNTGLAPCQFASGTWHHMIYFLQRVTSSGYQQIPAKFTSSSDTNTNLRFATLTIDGQTLFLGGLSNSTLQPTWSPVLGVQHQLDSSVSNATIEEYIDSQTIIAW